MGSTQMDEKLQISDDEDITTEEDDDQQPLSPTSVPQGGTGVSETEVETEINKRPQRAKRRPTYLGDYELNSDIDSSFHDAESDDLHFLDYICRVGEVPTSYSEAVNSNNSDLWKVAMQNEYDSLIQMNTFEFVPRPKGRKIIGGRWVFSTKNDENNQLIHKARFVAKGFSQIPSLDYGETFSPTARVTSIRMLCQMAVQENLEISQLDVKSAYLNANIDVDIFMEQPEGFEVYDGNGSKFVLKLNKSLYGLKQAGRMWNKLLHDFLISLKFTQSPSDHCVYIRIIDGTKTVLLVYVDDIIVGSSHEKAANFIKSSLANRFHMKDFGKISNFLGMEFEVNSQSIKIHQSQYVAKILERFKMSNCNPKSIPCDLSVAKLDLNTESPELEDPRLYREIVGSLIYLMTCTRADICYVISILSQFMSKPTMAHLNLAKFVLRYIKGTSTYGLIYVRSKNLDLTGYSDASWANSADRKSMSGYCFRLSTNSSLISWKTRKQPIVALSTCESEYIAMAFAMQECAFLQQLARDLRVFPDLHPCTLYVDNMGSIELSKNPVFHQRTKHLDIRFHYVREKVASGEVILSYVPSKSNVADIFTKPCSKLALSTFQVSKPI